MEICVLFIGSAVVVILVVVVVIASADGCICSCQHKINNISYKHISYDQCKQRNSALFRKENIHNIVDRSINKTSIKGQYKEMGLPAC